MVSLLDMKSLIPMVEEGLVEYSLKKTVRVDKRGLDFGEDVGLVEVFLGHLETQGMTAVKTLNSRKANPAKGKPLIYASISLYDGETGETLALIEGGSVTASRTAAASAVAAKHLSRENSSKLALIGTGRQGRTHLEALLLVRPLRQITVFDIHRESAEAFKEEGEEKYGIAIEIADSVQDAAEGADIIQLCTTTVEPVLFGKWIDAGCHINSIASSAPSVREVDDEIVLRSKCVSDSIPEALRGAGEFIKLDEKHLYGEIGEIAGGEKSGRSSPEEITFFKSMGLAVEDAVAALFLYRRALEENLGTRIVLED